jgi:hypothetical protein
MLPWLGWDGKGCVGMVKDLSGWFSDAEVCPGACQADADHGLDRPWSLAGAMPSAPPR